ncbi:MAG: cysteine--tRNA ligase [Promethearchaeota archaeon]
MAIMVYNTLGRKVEEFKPISEEDVKIYVCGPTVYDYPHLGHGRTYLAFDMIIRYLKYRGYNVKTIINITNIDDKIIKRAKNNNEDPQELADRFEQIYYEDMDALGIEKADFYPRVSDTIPEIVEFISTLIKKGNAYDSNGDVYFDVSTVEEFGKLSGQKIEEMRSGARIAVREGKRNPYDFALWKASEEGEPYWESPWGRGRPGWHIECSTMSMKYLGPQLDVHSGARDLIFPHHENEIMQSEAYTGKKPFVKYWIHTGFLTIDGEKMSKSLGNFITIRQLLEKYDPEAFRLFVASTHYRNPIDYSEESMNQAEQNLERIYNAKRLLKNAIASSQSTGAKNGFLEEISKIKQEFLISMDYDFNTAQALAQYFELIKLVYQAINQNTDKQILQTFLDTIDELGGIFGLFQRGRKVKEIPEEIKKLVAAREEARKQKDWKKSDEIRDKIKTMGYIIRDYPDRTDIIPLENE